MDRQEERVRGIGDEEKRASFLKKVAGIIASAEEEDSAPCLVYEINQVYVSLFGGLKSYEKEKKEFNALMLELEEEMDKDIRSGKDAKAILKNAINYARTGNYIDFGAMNHVDKEQLLELLHKAKGEEVDDRTFAMLTEELGVAKELVYLLDNCGEIVADKLLIKVIQEQYPEIHITVVARGMEVLNDAVIEDANDVGLTKIVEVIGNGNGIAGTQINKLSKEARTVLDKADISFVGGYYYFQRPGQF